LTLLSPLGIVPTGAQVAPTEYRAPPPKGRGAFYLSQRIQVGIEFDWKCREAGRRNESRPSFESRWNRNQQPQHPRRMGPQYGQATKGRLNCYAGGVAHPGKASTRGAAARIGDPHTFIYLELPTISRS